MPKIKANNIELNYEIRGNGPNLLFINGIGADKLTLITLITN